MSVIEANKDIFEKEVIKEKGKVLVDFNANWCGPCQMLKPILEQVSNEREDIKFLSLNVDQEENIAREYGIMSIPCLILFEFGKETKRTIGFQNKESIINFLGE